MIHVLDFDSNIIDFISNDDNSVIRAEYTRDSDSELLDITMLSQRAEHFKKRNRVIIQDRNDIYREFIIVRVEDGGQYVTIECNASYLHDINSAKPILAGKYEKTTVNDKLSEVLKDTGWIVGDCDFAGIRTMSWTSAQTPYEMIKLIETNHRLKASYEIVISGNEVVERKVNMREPVPLFKGKEILYGKDLVEMKRTIDFSEVKTALLALGPENDKGQRITTVVVDDEAQEQFNLPQRYIWGLYEPETKDNNMTLQRLTTLATTELNKRKSASISYEITVVDLEREYPHEVVRYGDLVRIKNSDFTPSLYAESEVIGFTHDLISDDCTYTFGRIVEYKEDDLLKYFRSKLDYFNQKLNDNITNVNTIVQDTLDTELQHYEKKIIKGDTPPENAVNDVFWLDTSNHNVPILKRYWEGQWIKASVDNAEEIGGITREKALFSELSNTFINLTIQHSKLLNEMHEVMNSEYLVDEDIKASLNTNLDKTVTVFNNIKSNLESMTEDTATIGKLVDTQALFLKYREQLQALYKVVEQAKISIDERFKLLQSQYTDEKFNKALSEVADKFGLQVSENNELIGEPDVVQKAISVVTEQTDNKLANYVKSQDYQTDKDGIVERLNNSDSERQQLSNQIADRVSLTTYNYDKFSNEQKLQTMKTEIIQDGTRIAQTVSNETFNAKAKTLNRVLSQYINDTTTGHQFTYDENGNISNFTVGSSGIKLNAKLIDMNDGDVIIKNGVTTIKDAYIDKLFSNNMTLKNSLIIAGVNNGIEGKFSYTDSPDSYMPHRYSGEYRLNNQALSFKGDVFKDTGQFAGYDTAFFSHGSVKFRRYVNKSWYENDRPSISTLDMNYQHLRFKRDGYPELKLENTGEATIPKIVSVRELINRERNIHVNVIHSNGGADFVIGVDEQGGFIKSEVTYNRTTSGNANVYIGQSGALYRSSSAMKYKTDIRREPPKNYKAILNLPSANWIDKNEEEHDMVKQRYFGHIAEDLIEVGLPEFVEYGDNREVESIMYERLVSPLLEVVKDHERQIKALEEKLDEQKS